MKLLGHASLRSFRLHPGLLAVSIAAITVSVLSASAQQSKNGQAQVPTQFSVTKAVCGAKGVTQGALFEMQDIRNVFHVPGDHEIIVYFEWDGPPGSHHAEGSWRSPDGKVALTSDFDLVSQGTLYSGTWRLALPETVATGLWALEAQIDGKPAGTQTFSIISDAPPPPPTAGEVYQRAAAASVFVTSLDADGEPISHGFGFFIDKGVLLTAFQVIDGATSVRVDLADGSAVKVGNVAGWSRRDDWAILKLDSGSTQPLQKAAPNSWKVGDLGYVLTSQGQGSRTIENVNITGLQGTVRSAQRLTISALGGGVSIGSPFMDANGHVVGVLGGGLAGFGSRRMGTWVFYVDSGEMAATITQPTVWPLANIPDPASQTPVSFADLMSRGALMPPLVRSSQVAEGTLCEGFQKEMGTAIMPVRAKNEFPRKLGSFALVVIWGPNEKVKGTQQLRVYDADNRMVAQTSPSKLNLEPHVTQYSAWKVPTTSLQPGIYRIDLLFSDQPQWRQFFKVSD